MSRIGKIPINVPSGIEVNIDCNKVSVKGPKGVLTRELSNVIKLVKDNNTILVRPSVETKASEVAKNVKAIWGLSRQLVNNMVIGVSQGFSITLIITGNGYKSSIITNKYLVLSLGYSHDIFMEIPLGIEVKCDKNSIVLSSSDKELVGLFASQVRAKRPTEPYKGRGIEYSNVVVVKKQSKKK